MRKADGGGYKATQGMELFLKRPVGVNGGAWKLLSELRKVYQFLKESDVLKRQKGLKYSCDQSIF